MKCDRCDDEATIYMHRDNMHWRLCRRHHLVYCQDVVADHLADQAEREPDPREEDPDDGP